jgi:hypothetical protein
VPLAERRDAFFVFSFVSCLSISPARVYANIWFSLLAVYFQVELAFA